MKNNLIYVLFFSLSLELSFIAEDSGRDFSFYQNVLGIMESNDLIENSKQFFQSVDNEMKLNFNQFYQSFSDWKQGKNNNETLIQKTNDYTSTLENISKKMENFSTSKEYSPIFQSYLKSINSEIDSNKHFVKYLETGNITENKISEDLFSKAAEYENQAIGAFNRINSELPN
jgi:hypothetical protein